MAFPKLLSRYFIPMMVSLACVLPLNAQPIGQASTDTRCLQTAPVENLKELPRPTIPATAVVRTISPKPTQPAVDADPLPKTAVIKRDQAAAKADPPKESALMRSARARALTSPRLQSLSVGALAYRGARYRWGGSTGSGFDCSGFTRYLYLREGIELPHSAKQQYGMGTRVRFEDLKCGDLVFFNTRGPLSHVGMYLDNGEFIHAANPRRGVRIDTLMSGYYKKTLAGARRYTR